ncbi:MAG: hypothetical protein DVB32_07580 [Verrucomicrobia bacterium]|nr:MAG: hypothetical protein DVB32_07580 [Verrucomicrobiota bacterium]
MTIFRVRINIFLGSFLACFLLVACKTTEQKKQGKEASTIQIFLENVNSAAEKRLITVGERMKTQVNVDLSPFADTADLLNATVVDIDEMGGFGIRLNFNDHGKLVLDTVTASSKGMRMPVLVAYTQVRWLGAPRINRRITDGSLVFTPDCTRQEAERIVRGLTNVIHKLSKPYVF